MIIFAFASCPCWMPTFGKTNLLNTPTDLLWVFVLMAFSRYQFKNTWWKYQRYELLPSLYCQELLWRYKPICGQISLRIHQLRSQSSWATLYHIQRFQLSTSRILQDSYCRMLWKLEWLWMLAQWMSSIFWDGSDLNWQLNMRTGNQSTTSLRHHGHRCPHPFQVQQVKDGSYGNHIYPLN